MEAQERDARLVLAATRGAFVAATQPAKSLGDAARAFGYRERTFEGDAFETAHEWASQQLEDARRLSEEAATARRLRGLPTGGPPSGPPSPVIPAEPPFPRRAGGG